MLIKKIPPEIKKSEWEKYKSPSLESLSSDKLAMVKQWGITNMLISSQKEILYDYGHEKIFKFAHLGYDMSQKADRYRSEYSSIRSSGFYKRDAFGQTLQFPLHNYTPTMLENMAKTHFGEGFEFRIAKDLNLWDCGHRDLVVPFNIPWYSDIRQQFYDQLRSFPIGVTLPKNAVIYIGSVTYKSIERNVLPLSWEAELNFWLFNNFVFSYENELAPSWPILLASTDNNELLRLEPRYTHPYMPDRSEYTRPIIPRYYVMDYVQLPNGPECNMTGKDVIQQDTPVYICLGTVLRHMPSDCLVNRARRKHTAFMRLSFQALRDDPDEGGFTWLDPKVDLRFCNYTINDSLTNISLEHRVFGVL